MYGLQLRVAVFLILRMDMEITVMVEAYLLFNEFGIHVTQDDHLQIDNLRFNFDRMVGMVSANFNFIFL